MSRQFQREEHIRIFLKENRVISRRDENFVGREAEIGLVLKYLINRKQYAITGVIGNGGVGKSAIANEIIHIIQDSWQGVYSHYLKEKVFDDGIMWIKLEHEQTLEQVFEEQIIKQLGVKLGLRDFEMEFHKLLIDRDILIVLDSAEQNQPIFNKLMKMLKNYPILVTSRKKHSGIKMLELETLDAKESFDLFRNHLDQEIAKEEKESIIKFCVNTLGGLPLAIKIIANYMKESGRKLSEIKQDLLQIEIEDDFREETISIDSVFKLSFDTLTPQAQKVFAIGAVFTYPFKEEYLLEITNKNKETTAITQEIDSLMKISFIEKNEEFYSYHPLLREYALKRLYTFAFSEAIFEAHKEYFVSLSENKLSLPLIYDELLLILEDDYKKGNFDRFFRIIENLDWWLSRVGYFNRRKDILSRAYSKAIDLKDKEMEYIFLRSYADSIYRHGNSKKAKEYFKMALKFKEEKEDFWLHYSLFLMNYNLNNYQESYIKNLEFSRKALMKNRTNYSSFLKTNSWICNGYYHFDVALDYAKINNLVQDTKSNNFKALLDLIDVFFYRVNYKKSLKYIKFLEEYCQDNDISIEDKLELKTLKLWIYLYREEEGFLNLMKYIKNRFNILEFETNDYDTLDEIEMLYYIQQSNFKNAKLSLEKIRDKETKEFALGIYGSYQDIEKAQKIFENYLKKEKLSPKGIARAKLYLAFVYAKQDKKQQAIQLLCDTQNIYKSYMNPIEKEIEKKIIDKVGIDEYIEIKSTIQIEKIDDEFFLENLPKSVIAKDGKKMMLIPQGFSTYGVDNFLIPTVDEIFEDVEMILNNDSKLKNIRYLGNFYMDKESVTNREYINYCKESGKEIPSGLEDKNPNGAVLDLGLTDMQEYAKFYGKVLPLPEEWEKACRGEENFNYPWGDEWDESIDEYKNENLLELEETFINHDTFEEYVEWFDNYQGESDIDIGFFNSVINEDITLDKFYFVKLFLNSLSLNHLEKFRILQSTPTLSQENVDGLIQTFEDEILKFIKLEKEYPKDIINLFKKMKKSSLNVLGEFFREVNIKLKKSKKDIEVESISPYGVKKYGCKWL